MANVSVAKVKKLERAMTEGVRRIDGLLADLLDYSVAGQDADVATETALSDAVAIALDNLKEAIAESGAAVEIGDLPALYARQPEMVSLFQNLIGNALKYRRSEPLKIKIRAERTYTEWRISVEDNGLGIKAEFLRHIFGMFKRLHGNEIPGTGMGLAICEKLVMKYGGHIWVESEFGRGSTFSFTLPLHPRSAVHGPN